MSYLGIYIRGLLMGMADVVPGVSGGTIAFIAGIYERLLFALRDLSRQGLPVLFKEGLQAFWVKQDMTFLSLLFAGVATSLWVFAHLIKYLLYQYPEALWSFFFGLILSSSWLLAKEVKQWQLAQAGWLLLGFACSTLLSLQAPIQVQPSQGVVFLVGCIAICAMILPGISGSFILVLLGFYETLISALKELDWSVLGSFLLGNLLGLFAFVHVVSYFLKYHRTQTFVFLLGLMLGSLIKIWPWKVTLSERVNSDGQIVPMLQKNIWPQEYATLSPGGVDVLTCLLLVLLGAAILLVVERVASARRV